MAPKVVKDGYHVREKTMKDAHRLFKSDRNRLLGSAGAVLCGGRALALILDSKRFNTTHALLRAGTKPENVVAVNKADDGFSRKCARLRVKACISLLSEVLVDGKLGLLYNDGTRASGLNCWNDMRAALRRVARRAVVAVTLVVRPKHGPSTANVLPVMRALHREGYEPPGSWGCLSKSIAKSERTYTFIVQRGLASKEAADMGLLSGNPLFELKTSARPQKTRGLLSGDHFVEGMKLKIDFLLRERPDRPKMSSAEDSAVGMWEKMRVRVHSAAPSARRRVLVYLRESLPWAHEDYLQWRKKSSAKCCKSGKKLCAEVARHWEAEGKLLASEIESLTTFALVDLGGGVCQGVLRWFAPERRLEHLHCTGVAGLEPARKANVTRGRSYLQVALDAETALRTDGRFLKSYPLIVGVYLGTTTYEELLWRLMVLLSVAGAARCTLSCSFRAESPGLSIAWYVKVTEFMSRKGFAPLPGFDEQTLGFGDESEIVTWTGKRDRDSRRRTI